MKKFLTLVLALMLLQGGISLKSQTLADDSLALVDIYNAGGGDATWTNWLTGNVSTWAGVVVSGGRVTELTTDGLEMTGTISPSIGNLTALTKLQLNGVESPLHIIDLHGTIPAELWNCTNLTRLQIKYTKVTGPLPEGIEKLQNLGEINFQMTYLNCPIPDTVFTLPNLTKAYLHQSNFTGAVPATVKKATKLVRLYLQGNKLTSLPYVDITNKGNAKVELTGNYFSFADVKPYADSSAQYLGYTNPYQLTQDTIDASVPVGSDYTMHGAVADGEAYSWFKDDNADPISTDDSLVLQKVTVSNTGYYVCKAQSSLVSGLDIRTVYHIEPVFNLESDSLALVDIYNAGGGDATWTNWLTGNVSTWAGVVVSGGRVTELTTDGLEMTGTISPSIGNLTALTKLQLNGVESPLHIIDLHGTIPAELWNCTNLTRLQIKYTKVTGPLPEGIEKLQNLGEINFQMTYLNCPIPDTVFTLPNLTKAYLHQSNFTGAVPATVKKATKLVRLYLQGNKLTSLPYVDITNKGNAKVELTGNYFSFADVKPYADSSAQYLGYTNPYQLAQDTTTVNADEGSSHTFSLNVTDGETYSWFKDDGTEPVSTDNSFTIDPIAQSDSGTYVCKVQSSMISSFDIRAAFILKVKAAVEAPTVSSAVTDETGTKINVTFSKDMSDPSTFVSDFTVKVNGSAVTINTVALGTDTKVVVIELNNAVATGDVILLSYAGTDVTSTDGGVLAAITDQTVTNNSTYTGISRSEVNYTVYPNPCTDQLVIKTSQKVKMVRIFDMTGKAIYERNNISGFIISIPVSNWSNGFYMLSVTTDQSSVIQKIVKK